MRISKAIKTDSANSAICQTAKGSDDIVSLDERLSSDARSPLDDVTFLTDGPFLEEGRFLNEPLSSDIFSDKSDEQHELSVLFRQFFSATSLEFQPKLFKHDDNYHKTLIQYQCPLYIKCL